MNENAIIETVEVAQPKLSREDLLQVLKYRYATKAWNKDQKNQRCGHADHLRSSTPRTDVIRL